jgi:heme/copper-type cytochrome/quinol oxidase subunit 2
MDSTKKIIFYTVVIVVVVALLAWAVWYGKHPGGAGLSPSSNSGSTGASTTSTSATRAAVPANTAAPNKGTSSTPANVAVPAIQGVGDPAGNVDFRSFNIAIANGAYSPNTVIVNQGDTVNLEVTAVDAAYGFDQPDYGFNAAIPQGKTQTIQFQALQSGDFTFYCVSCGGPSKGPVGHIIVVAK